MSGGSASSNSNTVTGTFAFTTASTTPNAGTASQGVTFTPTDTANYNTATTTVSVAVAKATPTITSVPTPGTLTYGQTLANSALVGGSASVAGQFTYSDTTVRPNAGSAIQAITFTPTNASNYNTTTGSVTVTVSKATPSITTNPTASSITYGQSLASSTLSGGVASAAGSFAFTSSTTAPNAGTASQGVTFTPTDTANYNTATTSVSVTVAKATPSITTIPSASDISFGQALSNSTLSSGVTSTAGSFAFTAPSTTPNAGLGSYSVTFTPTDSANFVVTTTTVDVRTVKATPSITTNPTASSITYGQALSSSILSGGNGSVPGQFAFTDSTQKPNAGTSAQSVTFTPTDNSNVSAITVNVNVTVAKATPTVVTAPTANGIIYGQSLSSSLLVGGAGSVAGSFAFTSPSTKPATGTNNYSVTFSPTDAANYNAITASVAVVVSKATPTISVIPQASGITYGQTLASATLSGGTSSTAGTFAFVSPTTAPNASTDSYTVTFTPTDTSNYTTASTSVTVVTSKANPTILTGPSPSTISYGQTLASSVLSGGSASVSGVFAYSANATAPSAGSSWQTITFTPTDTSNYNSVTDAVNITVSKAVPTVVTAPLATGITFGQALTASALSGGVASVAGSFAFTDSSLKPNAGTTTQSATFTPTDSANYQSATTNVRVVVAKATPSITTAPVASNITYGQSLAASALSGGVASTDGAFSFVDSTVKPTAGTATQSIAFTPTDTTNYTTASLTVSVTVARAIPTVPIAPKASTIVVGNALSTSVLTGGTSSVPGTFAFSDPSATPAAGSASQSVTFNPNDSANYQPTTVSITVKVLPLTPVVSSSSLTTAARGAVVTLTGTSLSGATVKVGTVGATVNPSSTDTELKFTIPVTAVIGAAQVAITTSGGSTQVPITVVAVPTVTSFTPANAARGASVQVVGTNLLGTTVTVAGVSASVASGSTATTVTFVVPTSVALGATTAVVTVAGVSVSKTFTVLPDAPTITTMSPTMAGKNMVISLTGTNLTAAAVSVGTVVAKVAAGATDTALEFTVPATAVVGANTVNVTTTGGKATTPITVIGLPTITSFTPASAKTGAVVTVAGTNLLNTHVTVDGINALITSGGTATSLKFTVPVGVKLGSTVVVITSIGGTASKAFTVLPDAPTITSFSQSTSTKRGVGTVTVTGKNLAGATVKVGTIVATVSAGGSSTSFTFTIPATAVVSATSSFSITTSGGTVTSAKTLKVTA